ncbi:uncharacterized protein LOC118436303 isoform X1 [Folsomia candida]|uniref:uncharacterized protein LOC118436303 isoform X1 n=1 Tax=Folsomia candida TaxID=158441 RepID=UPI0016053ACC|nr:uncharacterized protein LOC118436303 isoform X1 [Folsomia candida]
MINDVLNPDDLPVKSVFGNEIQAVDMPNYFRQYVQVFNQDELPSPMSLMEASALISNGHLVTNSVKKYAELMKKKQRGKQFMADGLLSSSHKAAMADAMKEFKSARKLGSKESIQTFEEDLNLKISEAFTKFDNDNKTKRAKLIDSAVQSSVTTYREALQSEFEDDDAFLEEKKLKNLAQSHQSTALSELKENLIECDDVLLEQTESALEKKLEEEQEKCLQDNKTRKLTAEKKISTAIKGICDLYEQDLSDHLDEDKYITLEELDAYDKESRPEFAKRFEKVKKLGPKDFMSLERIWTLICNNYLKRLRITKKLSSIRWKPKHRPFWIKLLQSQSNSSGQNWILITTSQRNKQNSRTRKSP